MNMTTEGKAKGYLKNLVESDMKIFSELRILAPNPVVKSHYEAKLKTLQNAMQRVEGEKSNTNIIETFRECIEEYRDQIHLGMSSTIRENIKSRIDTLQSLLDRFIAYLMMPAGERE